MRKPSPVRRVLQGATALLLFAPLAASASPEPSLAARMHESWAKATEARDRVVAGDLDGVKDAAQAVAAIGPDTELPPEWRPGAEQVRAAAHELAEAKDLAAAAAGVGKLAGACGSCHTTIGSGPDVDRGADLPPQKFEPGDNMHLHAWASQWLWLGVISGSEAAWQRGAKALNDQPLDLRWDEKPPDNGRQQLEQLVYVLASKAAEIPEAPERAELYGQFVATCAQCHSKTPSVPGGRSGPE